MSDLSDGRTPADSDKLEDCGTLLQSERVEQPRPKAQAAGLASFGATQAAL